MRISEFARQNQVTAKMLRHYDDVGLLKPSAIDPQTGYRSYEPGQALRLGWIVILKNLGFSLHEIKEVLGGLVDTREMIQQLVRKRIEISSALNEHTQRKIAIDRLIHLLEKEGFQMDKRIDLLALGQEDVHQVKKNMPNMEAFLDEAATIMATCAADEPLSVFRFDISHFKGINDEFGFEVGDRVIVACYQIIERSVRSRFRQAVIGRAAGDEFVVCAQADAEESRLTAQAIVADMQGYDFVSIGCPRPMSCYIGGLVGHPGAVTQLRHMIEDAIEVLEFARGRGPNSVAIEACAIGG